MLGQRYKIESNSQLAGNIASAGSAVYARPKIQN